MVSRKAIKAEQSATREGIRGTRIRVRAASYAKISFDVAAPKAAELVVEHRRRTRLLARECRPLKVGCRALEIKTHPRASHVACALSVAGQSLDGVRFDVEPGEDIGPIGRYFIIIGAMKAGTTTLFNLLAQHPAICQTRVEVPGMSFTKEINYFRKLYRKNHTALHYDWRFPFEPSKHSWTLDVSPGYAKWPGSKRVPQRIASLGEQTKLAYILREPVDRIESHLAHTLRSTGELKSLKHCIRTSRYALHLDKFTAHVPRDNILLLDFEELCQDPAAVLSQICDFLSIERFVGRFEVHNRRGVEFALGAAQRAELATAVSADVQRLIDRYGFEPARNWLREYRDDPDTIVD